MATEVSLLDEPRLRRLLEVGRTMVAGLDLDLDEVLERVVEVSRELTGARYAALGILDEERRELERFVTVGVDEATHRAIGELPRGRGVLGVLIDEPRPLRLDDVGRHPRSYGFPPGHPPMTTFLGVPVLVRGEAWGNLYLTDREGGPFTEADEEAIGVLADWAAIAIDNARAYGSEFARRAELEQAVRRLEATTAIARALGGETDLDRVLELIVGRARALVGARGLVILLHDEDQLEVAALAGRLDPGLLGVRFPVEGAVTGHVLRTRRPQRMSDLSPLRYALGEMVEAKAGLFMPLVFRGTGVGVLCAFDRGSGEEFTADDERLLEGFAASAATAVATAQNVAAAARRRAIEASERERQRWARELHDETLQELAGLKVLLASARRTDDPALTREVVERAIGQIELSITGLRHLITELRPAALDQLGLGAALQALVERTGATAGLDIAARIDMAYEAGAAPTRLEGPVEDAAYRLVQEALTNVVKHSGAEHVEVEVIERDGRLRVAVGDDGAGFDPSADTSGFGVVGMRERVALLGGELELSAAPGAGTRLSAVLPAPHLPSVRVQRRPAAPDANAG